MSAPPRSRIEGDRPVQGRVPWLAGVSGRPERNSDDVVVVTGWLVGPGDPPEPSASIGAHRVPLRLASSSAGIPGIPAGWPVWTWQVDVEERFGVDLVLRSDDGREIFRRNGVGSAAPGVVSVQGHVEFPAEGTELVGDLVAVSGWLLLNGQAPHRVEVEVDGSVPVRARLMLARPDIALGWPTAPDAVMCGYQARVPIETAPGRSRQLTVRVTGFTDQGRSWTAPLRTCSIAGPVVPPAVEAAAQRVDEFTRQLLSRIPQRRDPDHVLIFGHSLRIGGGELWLTELIGKLIRDHGLRITVVTLADGPLRAELESLGVEVWVTGEHRVHDATTYQAYVSELAMFARASGAGVVLANTLGLFAGVDAALHADLPVAWVIHESFTLADYSFLNWGQSGQSPMVRRRWEHCLAASDVLVFVADATRDLFLRYAAPSRCLTVRYGIDLESVNGFDEAVSTTELRRSLNIPADAQVILTVGVSEPRKGHGLLVRAFERVRRVCPQTHLVIVGVHQSPYCQALAARVAAGGLTDCVSLVPITQETAQYFRIADLFVNASDVESLPRSILEAIAYGLPVLAADAFGTRELITDAVTGWLFNSNDLDALTAGLLRALDTPTEQRAPLIEAAREHVAPFLDSSGYGTQIAALLGSLAAPLTALGGASRGR